MNWKHLLLGKTKKTMVLNVIAVLLLLYVIVIMFFTHLFFSEKRTIGSITFYSNDKKMLVANTLQQIEVQLKQLPMYNKAIHLNIFFTNSWTIYMLLNPLNRTSLATASTFFNYKRIIVSKTDFDTGTVENNKKEWNTRDITSLIVHESCHCYFARIHALLTRLKMPSWKEEGLCEYYSNGSSYSVEKGFYNLKNNKENSSLSYKYFKYRFLVSYMANIEKKQIDDIIKDKRPLDEVYKEAAQYIKTTPIEELIEKMKF